MTGINRLITGTSDVWIGRWIGGRNGLILTDELIWCLLSHHLHLHGEEGTWSLYQLTKSALTAGPARPKTLLAAFHKGTSCGSASERGCRKMCMTGNSSVPPERISRTAAARRAFLAAGAAFHRQTRFRSGRDPETQRIPNYSRVLTPIWAIPPHSNVTKNSRHGGWTGDANTQTGVDAFRRPAPSSGGRSAKSAESQPLRLRIRGETACVPSDKSKE